jgi:hypothetical protein
MIGYQFLLEIDALDGVGAAVTLRFCCQPGYSGGGFTWSPFIVDPGLYQVDLFSGGKTTGPSSNSYGEIILGNFKNVSDATGPTDFLKPYQFYGRAIRMFWGLQGAAFPSGFTQGYSAIIETPTFSWDTITLPLRGPQKLLEQPLDPSWKFDGNNLLPDGFEGGAESAGKQKPYLLGRGFNLTPHCVNTSKLIYTVSPIYGIGVTDFNSDLHVYDNGVELFMEPLTGAIDVSAPLPGQFTSDGSYIRLGSSPQGQLTVSAVMRGQGMTSNAGMLVKSFMDSIAPGFTSAATYTDLADYSAFEKYERGIYVTDENTTKAQVIDQMLTPLGWYYFDNTGMMRIGRMAEPETLLSIYTLDSRVNIATINFRPTEDTTGGVPANTITMKYGRNYTPQPATQLAGSVTTDRKAILAAEWKSNTDPGVNSSNPLKDEMIFETSFTGPAPTVLNTLKTLYQVQREIAEIQIINSEFIPALTTITPGCCMTLVLAGRFGYVAKKMIVIGITVSFVDRTVSVRLWG